MTPRVIQRFDCCVGDNAGGHAPGCRRPRDVEHGTYQGWNWHQRTGVPLCRDCTDAGSRYMRDYRRRNLTPIELPDERYFDLAGGVGLAYAQAVRESA